MQYLNRFSNFNKMQFSVLSVSYERHMDTLVVHCSICLWLCSNVIIKNTYNLFVFENERLSFVRIQLSGTYGKFESDSVHFAILFPFAAIRCGISVDWLLFSLDEFNKICIPRKRAGKIRISKVRTFFE